MKPSPIWLLPETVLAVHQRQLAEHGGAVGVRDKALLDSALARPRNLYAYGTPPPDMADLAAAYAFGISRNHPFVDGNKRVSLVLMLTFLVLNGANIVARAEEIYLVMMRLAAGELSEEDLAAWLRARLYAVTVDER